MLSKLIIRKVKSGNIFCSDFEDLTHNNVIEFSGRGIAVLYGPNGVGKTSFVNVINNQANTELDCDYDGKAIDRGETGIFHVVVDQNGRNIIHGSTEDFLLGDNIRYERKLKNDIDEEFSRVKSGLISKLKELNITKKSSELIAKITDEKLRVFAQNLANKQSKGRSIDLAEFLDKVGQLNKISIEEYDQEKLKFLVNDFEMKGSAIKKVLSVTENMLGHNVKIREIEENDQAIQILSKFSYKSECIVCDTKINPKELLNKKENNRNQIFQQLDDDTRSILESINKFINENDPFAIKKTIMLAIENGDETELLKLQAEIYYYFKVFNTIVNNIFFDCLQETDLFDEWKEYLELLEKKLEISNEDVQYIENILNDNIDRKITLERDADTNNIKLLLGGREFLEEVREKLALSTGEQNFISLTFELLRAKNLDKKIIVIDDPISSFDSIYKNKIAYAIIKFLEGKKQLILTHNLDLIRLLEFQYRDCFKLYLLNNTDGEVNGFINVNDNEREILLKINRLLDFLRTDAFKEMKDEELFLLSMIPFMRGYAQLINKTTLKEKLTLLMHGYNHKKVEISKIYKELFDGPLVRFNEKHIISVDDILSINLDGFENVEILNPSQYSLLNRTLKHSLIYLFLRLFVEKVLVDTYSLDKKQNDTLGKIIDSALKAKGDRNRRIYLTSRKTLLNEFNHFEGNMSIFQPAIDISDSSLNKEKEGILKLLKEIREEKTWPA